MSGTSNGACILHVAPKAYVGRPLALVKTGDIIGIDIPARGIRLQVFDEELLRRRTALTGPAPGTSAATAGCPHAIFAKLTKVAILTSWRRASAAPSTSRRYIEPWVAKQHVPKPRASISPGKWPAVSRKKSSLGEQPCNGEQLRGSRSISAGVVRSSEDPDRLPVYPIAQLIEINRHSVGNGGYIDLSRPVLETP
jgi:hypothetical protein